MNSLDIAILLIMAVSITVSSVRGGIRELFSLAAVIVGFILAAHFYHMASASFIRPTSHPEVNDTISFVSIFLFAAILISFIGGSLTHMAKKSKSLSPWNAIFGTAVGALKGLVISTLGAAAHCILSTASLTLARVPLVNVPTIFSLPLKTATNEAIDYQLSAGVGANTAWVTPLCYKTKL